MTAPLDAIAIPAQPTTLDREALETYFLDTMDLADRWVLTCNALGLDPHETTPADLLHAGDEAEQEIEPDLMPERGFPIHVPAIYAAAMADEAVSS